MENVGNIFGIQCFPSQRMHICMYIYLLVGWIKGVRMRVKFTRDGLRSGPGNTNKFASLEEFWALKFSCIFVMNKYRLIPMALYASPPGFICLCLPFSFFSNSSNFFHLVNFELIVIFA